jgi:hypothetical protein
MVVIGERTGLYRALAAGPMTSSELAGKTGTDERYVREWLGSQAEGGYVSYERFRRATETPFNLVLEARP